MNLVWGISAKYYSNDEERKLLLLIGKNASKARVGKTDGEHNDVKKKVYGILLLTAVVVILLLTLQTQQEL